MPKYMFQARYTAEGAKGILAAGGSARRSAVEKACASVNGKLESYYFAFGGVDAFVVAELPDDVAAAALSMAVGASGGASTMTVKLLSVEDMDKASKVAVAYRPPGK
jgi:uncharacterized protein with GYD domain